MTVPLVSVHMITYNHAPFIVQSIEGVLQQKVKFHIELVIGEDYSSDGTREIVFEYQKKYPNNIRVITSDKNVGATKNSYRTIKACRGKYIAFCEGDDYWHNPYKLQKQVDYMESHQECGLVFADCDVYYNRSNKFIRNFNYNKGFRSSANLTIEEIMWGEMVEFTCTAMTRKYLYDRVIESDPYLHKSGKFRLGDQQAWAELSLISEVSYIPECLATYRVIDESASRSKDSKKVWQFYKSVNEMRLYLCDKHKLSENNRIREESYYLDISLRLAFLERNADLAMEVKKKKQTFTWKEWLRYFGAKYIAIHYGYRAVAFLLNIFRKFRKEAKEWP
jgi:glycosyltransferase involved in cell wall biosynthesis